MCRKIQFIFPVKKKVKYFLLKIQTENCQKESHFRTFLSKYSPECLSFMSLIAASNDEH